VCGFVRLRVTSHKHRLLVVVCLSPRNSCLLSLSAEASEAQGEPREGEAVAGASGSTPGADVLTGERWMASDKAAPGGRGPRVLLCVTGSVATIKAAELVTGLVAAGASVRMVASQGACHFLNTIPQTAAEQPALLQCAGVSVYTDADEWSSWQGRGDPVLHITLRRWADILLIAPLSANTMAKLAHGMADNLVTCVARAWDQRRPVLVAPAMNTAMWEHPHTAKVRAVNATQTVPYLFLLTRSTTQHLAELATLEMRIIQPVEKRLVCGDTGIGAMADVGSIVREVTTAWRLRCEREKIGAEAVRQQQEDEAIAAQAELDRLAHRQNP
jgi:phosphopantothenoylcysteine decarboxylase